MHNPEPLWTAQKGRVVIRATLRNRRALGWEVVLLVDDQPWKGAHYDTRAEAITDADTYWHALQEKGWSLSS